MSNTPHSRDWELEWHYFADCECAWTGKRPKLKALWDTLKVHEDLQKILGEDGKIGESGSLISVIQGFMKDVNFYTPWNRWHKNLNVGVRVWPKAIVDSNLDPRREEVHAVLTSDSFYLILSKHLKIKGVDIKVKYTDNSTAQVTVNENHPVDIRVLSAEPEEQIWLYPYMLVVDNGVVWGQNATFRENIEGLPDGSNGPTRRRSISELISEMAGDPLNKNGPLKKMHSRIKYDVDVSKEIHESKFFYDGSDIGLLIGPKKPGNHPQAVPSEHSESEDVKSVPDYPCGNYDWAESVEDPESNSEG